MIWNHFLLLSKEKINLNQLYPVVLNIFHLSNINNSFRTKNSHRFFSSDQLNHLIKSVFHPETSFTFYLFTKRKNPLFSHHLFITAKKYYAVKENLLFLGNISGSFLPFNRWSLQKFKESTSPTESIGGNTMNLFILTLDDRPNFWYTKTTIIMFVI